MRWGEAIAYDRNGKKIHEWSLRKVAGHASVTFSYYPDGGVKKAYWSSAPDGGIQWYKTTTYFEEDGTVSKELEDKHDRLGGSGIVQLRPRRKPVVKQEVAECATIYSSEFWFENTTKRTVVIKVSHRHRSNEVKEIVLHPKETKKGGYIIEAERFLSPEAYYDFSCAPQNKRMKQDLIIVPSKKGPEQQTKEVRKYTYQIRRSQ